MPMAQTDSPNDIVGQAHQGSVAAIIQVLNEELADASIRTRAILADGVLQLLCEAPTVEQLPQQEVVRRVQGTLERLSPRHIRKVNINSRIVREQQLLWLEEITRDPENQLLWSELITLKGPNPLKRFWQDLRRPRSPAPLPASDSKRNRLKKHYFLRGLVGGASLCVFLMLVGWALRHRLAATWFPFEEDNQVPEATVSQPTPIATAHDSFAQAVRLAEQAAADGQRAATSAEWLELAARWQRASELMAEVSAADTRYITAQDRVLAYQNNSEQALLRAQQIQQREADN